MINKYDEELEETPDIEEEIPDFNDLISPKELKKQKKKERDQEDYLNKEKMWGALRDFYTQVEKTPNMMIPLELAHMVDDIITNITHKPNFNGYVKNSNWLVDMIGDAKVKCFKAVADKSFSLYTTAPILVETDVEDTNGVQKWVYYIHKKAKKKQLVSDKSVLFEDPETCRNAVLSGNLKKTNLIVMKHPELGSYFTVNIRVLEPEDVIDREQNTLTFKSNPFGFFTTTVHHCFINRIKKNKQIQDTMKEYQEEIYESMYASETWRNVRRQKVFYDDDGEGIIEEVVE